MLRFLWPDISQFLIALSFYGMLEAVIDHRGLAPGLPIDPIVRWQPAISSPPLDQAPYLGTEIQRSHNMLGNAPVVATLPCVDIEGARNFYGGILGLKEVDIPEMPEELARFNALYECGQGTNLMVYSRETPTQADHTAAGWLVEDLDDVVNQLISQGVKLEVYDMPGVEWDERGVATMGSSRGAWFKDPEGNILSLSQMP